MVTDKIFIQEILWSKFNYNEYYAEIDLDTFF